MAFFGIGLATGWTVRGSNPVQTGLGAHYGYWDFSVGTAAGAWC